MSNEAAEDDGNNNSSSLTVSQENPEGFEEFFLVWEMEEDAMHGSDNDDDDESEEEESSVSNGNNSSSTSLSLEDAMRNVAEAIQRAGQMDVRQNQTREEESSVWNSNQSSTEDGNNNSNRSSTSFILEDLQRYAEQAFQTDGQMGDVMQNQQGTTYIHAGRINNEDGSVRSFIIMSAVSSLNINVGSLSIDGMSYEELMELEERIGLVKIGLPKEIIVQQLKTRVCTTSEDSTGEEETEICTICQDGYENQDKIATLDCKHEYHQECITKWLVRKNLCPICKRQALKPMEESKKEEVVNEC